MSKDPVIVGVAESDLGVTGKSILQLTAQASLKAVAEAGLTLDDVDGIATAGVARFSASAAAEYLGITPIWMDSTFEGGSSFELQLNRAAEAIRTGSAEVVLIAYGSNQRSASLRTLGGITFPHTPEAQFEVPFGSLNPISMYALAAQRHMHEFGTRPEDLAEIAVAARAWALLNPAAYRYGAGPLTIGDVLGSPMISTPLHRLDCCLVTDGGGAVVVTSRDRASDVATSPISVLGYGETTTHVAMSQMPDLTSTGAVTSGARAFAMAGLRPEDVDVVEVYDSFTITTLLTLEALGSLIGVRAPPSSPTVASPRVAGCRSIPAAAAFRTATRACSAYSCSSKPFASYVEKEALARSREPRSPWSTARVAS